MSHTILVVDDVSDWRDMLAGLIEDVYPKFKVVTASSIDEAKNQLTQHNFDLAILDVRLDESDESNTEGLVLMEFIRGHYTQLPVLIITGYPNLDTVRQAMRPGESGIRPAVDYLEKAKLNIELLPRISEILGES